jgi:hypothetical protein
VDARLVVEAQRAGDPERQRRRVDQRRQDAHARGGGPLALQRLAFGLRLGEHEGRDPLEVAFDPALVGERRDAFDGGALTGGGQTRPTRAEPRHQGVIGDVQHLRQVRGGLSRLPFADPTRLDDRDVSPRPRQEQCGGDPGDAASDHGHVDRHVARQGLVRRSGGGF